MQLSTAILNAPVVLFLGAGASQPLGKPTMVPFVSALVDKLQAAKHPDYDMVWHLAGSCNGDLENILGELDAALHIKAFRLEAHVNSAKHINVTKDVANRIRILIEKEILDEYFEVSADLTNKLYGPFFDLIFSTVDPEKYCLPIFTTNYDTAIETFCDVNLDYELVDGFKPEGRKDFFWNPAAFHEYQLKPKQRNIVLFKLHGSANWMRLKKKKVIARLPTTVHQQADEARYENALIYPATHKVATEEPYFTAYDYYGRCCERARLLITIGYSFRDYDALARLRSAMSVNPDLIHTLIAPNCDEVLAKLPFKAHKQVGLAQCFGAEGENADLFTTVRKLLAGFAGGEAASRLESA